MIKLIQGDCIEEMAKLPAQSIDMVLTDPPYGTTQCKWDSVVPFSEMWQQINRVKTATCAVVLFGSEPFSSLLRCSNLQDYKYDWVWQKRPVNFLNAKRQPLRKTERISVFSGKMYNPQGLIYKPRTVKRTNSTETVGTHGNENISNWTNYPTDVLEFIGERGLHPTQKPVALMEYLIKTYTKEGDTVLDFTMGSGTTGVACKNLNRNFVGIEKDEKYSKIAENRIK